MVFSELIFLCFFLPLLIISYFLCKNRVYRNVVLLLFSLLFYAWGEPIYLFLMLGVVLVAYLGGLLIDKFKDKKTLCKTVFIITVCLIVSNLLFFKYTNFFFNNLGLLFKRDFSIGEIILPIGISFYTFQILSYVIDLYWGNIGLQKNYFYLLLYLSFFPQLIAGPIVRYSTVEYEISNRQENLNEFAAGLRRFIVGLAKKVIIANQVASVAEIIYAGNADYYGTVMYWIASLAYTLQLYFDFSAYSDMAIGIGQMFGFHFLENFNYPYIATSITDFWRRWHISLSTFFRDYIYIPLGGNRVSKARHIFNLLVVWALTGFWHGADWNFILWGLYYGILLILEKYVFKKVLDKLPKIIGWIYSFIIVNIGWVLFNLTDFTQLKTAFKTMFTLVPTDWMTVFGTNTDIFFGLIYIPLGCIAAFPILPYLKKKIGNGLSGTIIQNTACLALLVLCIVYIVSSDYNPFIYFRF